MRCGEEQYSCIAGLVDQVFAKLYGWVLIACTMVTGVGFLSMHPGFVWVRDIGRSNSRTTAVWSYVMTGGTSCRNLIAEGSFLQLDCHPFV